MWDTLTSHENTMERAAGIEPATHSLEGCGSTTELCPLLAVAPLGGRALEAGGGRRIRTSEGISQQIYSLPSLTT